MRKEIVENYLINKMCWPNKDTTPVIKISSIKYSDCKSNINVVYEVLFKIKDCDVLNPYMKIDNCKIWLENIKEYTRENSLNLLLNDI